MEIKNTLSESFDFIEESCGSGEPTFEFFNEPQQVVSESADGAPSYPIIGRASGVFAPIGVMSRNNRIYDNDHYDYLLENQQLVDRIAHRGMLGTIGHHDKKVDDQDLAEGKVSHIVTNLKIVEEADGSRNLYGVLEILDTPAGHLLKTYYDSGVPLFVSSRGGGNLLPVPNESYKRVDKTKYFLETFDIVKNPGFLQAKPVYEKVSESAEEIDEKVIVATKDHMENVEADKLAKERAKDGKTGLVDCGGKVDLDGSMAAQKKRLEAKCNEETEDKLDKLIESVSSLVTAISEGDKKVVIKQEDNEKKESAEKKEAKETKEAPEAKETKIVEEKKDDEKEKDKPEDEKNDDAESAVASSVTEEEKLPKKYQKMVDTTMNPHANMTKADIANGNIQTKLISRADAIYNAKVAQKADQERAQAMKELKARATKKAEAPKKEYVQKKLFEGALQINEYNKEAAQKVIDRKTKQLVDSSKDMKNTENSYKKAMSNDFGAIQHDGQYVSRATDNASSDHKESIQKGANLNRGALRIVKAGKKKGCDTDNLKYAGQGHAQEVNRQVQAHHDIKHMHEENEYDKNMKIANDYDKQFMREPANSPDGSPNPVANHYKSKYQEYFDRAMAAKQKSNPNNGVKPTTPQQKASAGKMNYMKEVHNKMNDKNSKIEQALKTIAEADQALVQPIVAVQNAGNSTKSAKEANPEVKEPVTMDRLELARALKAKVNNDKKVEV